VAVHRLVHHPVLVEAALKALHQVALGHRLVVVYHSAFLITFIFFLTFY
jgi:hypothetical protein